MLHAITGFLKKLFRISDNTVQESPKETFSIGHGWPFPSPEPPNPEYLVGELIKGVEVEGDHVFFYWKGQKRRHIRTERGTETVLARNIVWWMDGRKVPKTANGLTTNCGEQKCLKLSHLILRIPQTVYGPENAPVKANHVTKRNQPPKPPSIRPGNVSRLEKFSSESRMKCITRKAYFNTISQAKRYAVELNHPDVRGTGRRQYAYDCTQCDGFHLTKIDPKKFNKGSKKVGSW